MKRFTLIKKASPVNYALESTRTLDNGVVLRLIHCGDKLTVTAAYEKQLESFADLRSVEEAAYIEDYLTRKYSGVDAADLQLDAGKLAHIIALLGEGKLTRAAAKQTLEAVFAENVDVDAFIREKGLLVERDAGAVAAAVEQVLRDNPDAVEKFRAGNEKVYGFLTGQCMKLLRGKADPKDVNAALREALAK